MRKSLIRPIVFVIAFAYCCICLVSCKRAAEVVADAVGQKQASLENPRTQWASHFLEDSALLSKLNMVITPVTDVKAHSIYVDRMSIVGKPFLVSFDGNLYGIHIDTASTLPSDPKLDIDNPIVLQSDDPAQILRGHFILTGDVKPNAIKWAEAQKVEVDPSPACVSYKPTFGLRSLYFSKADNVPSSIYVARWIQQSHSEGENPTSVRKIHEVIGIVDGTNHCTVLKERDTDEERGAGEVKGLAGILKIQSGSENEEWWVFEGAAYENAAYYALLRSSNSNIPVDKDEWISYGPD